MLASLFSARQPATVALDVGLSLIRIVLPFLIIFLTQELISKEFTFRYHLVSLTYPRQRELWLVARFFTTYIIGVGMLFLSGVILSIELRLISAGYQQTTDISLGIPYLITLGIISVDLFVITAVATLLAITARTPSFITIGTVGFMIVARSYSYVINLLNNNIDPMISEYVDQDAYTSSLSVLRFIVPDLAALDMRHLSLYNGVYTVPDNLLWLVASALGYGTAIIAIATWLMSRRAMS
jgi:ABC-type transport system involved in multi-copper enzyme maturation permease subunit